MGMLQRNSGVIVGNVWVVSKQERWLFVKRKAEEPKVRKEGE